jgi:hypothetical protein
METRIGGGQGAARTTNHPQWWLTVGGGIGIVLLVAVGWWALRSPAAAPTAGPPRALADVPTTAESPPLAPGAMTPTGATRLVFTRVRSVAAP